MKLRFALAIGTVFGIGRIPFAPGTFGSLAAALFYLLLPAMRPLAIIVPLIIIVSLLGVWAGGVMEEEYGNDPSAVVIDELAGQWLALAALPGGAVTVALSFAFFRLFDIAKPGPVDRVQRLPGGWGIMTDDLLAGVLANLSVRFLMFVLSF
ncbi:MAG: phosphatidylglycerophosphatase A [Chlorobiaceae bacterium]|nr:phosphatidylglycerophosphatase A [Chlorobiaceae bacterium]